MLDDVALPVEHRVEVRWSPADAAFDGLAGDLVDTFVQQWKKLRIVGGLSGVSTTAGSRPGPSTL
ncbi:hypothetical protein ABIA35_007574 [Catenulispora sp. MAP12-49]|uniref:hypothetical protein n=1 Tax=Catenulispora sp. MAP12-49 TaxID=3156302 RepID=UPI003515588C